MYGGCPIYWKSKLQTKTALSMMEAEYFALSHSMREVLPFLTLLKEIHDVFPLQELNPEFFCQVWEDTCSCIKVAESPKFTCRTKHISLMYHHFQQFISNWTIKINPINTCKQLANIFTKPLDEKLYTYKRDYVADSHISSSLQGSVGIFHDLKLFESFEIELLLIK